MKTVGVVAETSSVARSIGRARGGGEADSFEGRFDGEDVWYKLASTQGHLFEVDFPETYNEWSAVEPKELFDAPLRRRPSGAVKSIREASIGAATLVLCLDNDREGEAISFEVMDVAGIEDVRRARFSATQPKDILDAFRHLTSPDPRLADAVAARQEIDLRIGVALTRFLTTHFQQKYHGLDSKTLSFGPCQTPTLGFVVARQDEISAFMPENFWVLKATSSLDVSIEWVRRRCFDEALAAALVSPLLHCSEEYAVVLSVAVTTTEKMPPLGLNTVDLLKLGSRLLRLSPRDTMRYAERLYLEGYISYPRTETTQYPDSFDIRHALLLQRDDPRWGDDVVAELLEQQTPTGHHHRRGIDAGDHPPVTPTASGTDLRGPAGRLYELITRRFLASVSGPAISETASVRVRHFPTDELFDMSKVADLDPGFTKAFQRENDETAPDVLKRLAQLERGERVEIRVSKQMRTTEPPQLLTEADCVALMEGSKIGTDASISTHIDTIVKRGYVVVEKHTRAMRATDLGIALYRGLRKVDDDLVTPFVRAHIEELCDFIAKGDHTKSDVVDFILENFQRKFSYLVNNVAILENIFEVLLTQRDDHGVVDDARFCLDGVSATYFGLVKKRKPARLVNEFTQDVISLPQGGDYKPSNGVMCPRCRSEAIWFRLVDANASKAASQNRKTITYPLCPRCFDRGTPSMNNLVECPLPDTHPLVQKYRVATTKGFDGRGGVILLEPVGGKLLTTRDPVMVGVFAHIVKTVRLVQNQLEVTFTESPLDDGSLVCRRPLDDPLLRSLLAVTPAKLTPPPPKESSQRSKGLRKGRKR